MDCPRATHGTACALEGGRLHGTVDRVDGQCDIGQGYTEDF